MQGRIIERVKKKGIDSQGRIRNNIKIYDVKYRYKDIHTGKAKETMKRGFTTKGDAQRFLLDLNNRLATNTFLVIKAIAFRDYLNEWLDIYAKVKLRPTTYIGYKRIIEKHLIPHLGNYELKSITAMQIDKLYAYLLQRGRADGKGGLSAKTVLYTHRVLNEIMEHAVKKQLIYHNPVRSVTNTPKPKKFKGNIYSPEEILELMELVRNTQFEIPVALAAVCGLRRGECLALTEADIDFDNKIISINKQLLDIDNEVVSGEPKSEESNRVISAPQEIFDIIQRHLYHHEKNKQLLQHEYEDNGLIVCQNDGKPIRPVYFTKNFTRLIKANKLKTIRFHDLRHSCATLMLRSGVAMKTASQILGHSSISITADLYTHVMEDTKRQAALQVGQKLFGKNDDK